MSNKIRINLNQATVTEESNKRGRMKITFKLTKEDAEGFKQFREAFKPQDISDEDFSKHIFMLGARTMTEEFQRHIDKTKEALEAQKKAALENQVETPVNDEEGS